MSTITTINESDLITNSRATINTNFSNLNTDKIETSVLDTDTTLAANSDSKIATQKAVKAYVDAGGQANASDTVKGIVEEATQAEVDAGTTTGGTGARLYVNPSMIAFSGCRVYQNAGVGINAATILSFQVENFDNGGYHDNVTNNSRITVPSGKGGKYHIGASLDVSGAYTSKLSIKLNGATYIANNVGGSETGYDGCTVSTIYELAVGDYVEVEAKAANASANSSGDAQTNFWAYKIA